MITNLQRDRLILIVTVWDEARNQGRDGIRAVVWSIINRHNAGKWYSRKTIAGCCLLAYQYSSWNMKDPNREAGLEMDLEKDTTIPLIETEVDLALAGQSTDPTNGATHYYNPKATDGTPDWVTSATHTATIGAHEFYKDVA